MEYDGKNITIRASYVLGFEEQVMFAMKCPNLMTLAFMPKGFKAERVIRKARRNWGIFNATFYGTFHKERLINVIGIHDLHQFDVYSMENIEVISKKTVDPEKLSKKTQQKLCQGDEVLKIRTKP
jgi:hypothetical protein